MLETGRGIDSVCSKFLTTTAELSHPALDIDQGSMPMVSHHNPDPPSNFKIFKVCVDSKMDTPTNFVVGALDDRDCATALTNAFKNPSIDRVLKMLRKTHKLNVVARNCPGESLRGYFEVPPGDTVVLCCNNFRDERSLLKTLEHELVHAVDYLERAYNFHDPEQLACSEVTPS